MQKTSLVFFMFGFSIVALKFQKKMDLCMEVSGEYKSLLSMSPTSNIKEWQLLLQTANKTASNQVDNCNDVLDSPTRKDARRNQTVIFCFVKFLLSFNTPSLSFSKAIDGCTALNPR